MEHENFTGRTEKHLLKILEDNGRISAVEIFAAYSSLSSGQAFMQKLIHFKIAKLVGPGVFKLIETPQETEVSNK